MMTSKSIIALAMAKLATAHFGLVYPEWRADTLSEENEDKYSQWTYPCAGVDYGEGNTTEWPLDGGAVKLDLHHPWTYVFINLGLGDNSTNFNITLTPELWNATGKGTLCVNKLELPEKVADGTNGTLQVITVGDTGSALYNCADIRFSKNAKKLDNCTSEGVDVKTIKDQSSNDTEDQSSSSANSSDSKDGDSSGDDNGAGFLSVNKVALASTVGLAATFIMGLGL